MSIQNHFYDLSRLLSVSISPAKIKESYDAVKCECNQIAHAHNLPQQAYKIKNYEKFILRVLFIVSFQDPTPHGEEDLVTIERFLGSCKLSILDFGKANHIAVCC